MRPVARTARLLTGRSITHSTQCRQAEPLDATDSRHPSTSSIGVPDVTDPMLMYRGMVARGLIRQDEQQIRMLVKLREIHNILNEYEPPRSLITQFDAIGKAASEAASSSSTLTSTFSKFSLSALSNNQRSKALVRLLSDDERLLTLDTPLGFMLTGPPGTGKSLLMDIFFKSLPTSRKMRRHYDHFLLSLYHKTFTYLESQRQSMDDQELAMNAAYAAGDRKAFPWSRREEAKALALSKGWRSVFAGGRKLTDPSLKKEYVLACIARDMIVNDGWLLAFDEFQLVDVAGASILRQLLQFYWSFGGVVIATSNRLPDDLYQSGVQRDQFLAFINILSTRCPVLQLDSPVDYRRGARSSTFQSNELESSKSWFVLPKEKAEFEEIISKITKNDRGTESSITVYGRKVRIPWATKNVARFTFDQLCRSELGPADYVSLTSKFSTIVVDNAPILLIHQKNEARRLITLLDALYETKCRLLCSAQAPIDDLFFPDAVESSSQDAEADSVTEEALSELFMDPYRPNVSSYREQENEDQAMAEPSTPPAQRRAVDAADERHPSASVPAFKTLAIFSGQDERFAFRRAVSRLHEMNSAEYWQTAEHSPMPEEARTWERPFNLASLRQESLNETTLNYDADAIEDPEKVGKPINPQIDMLRTKWPEGREAGIAESQRKKRGGKKIDPLSVEDPYLLEPPTISENHIWGTLSMSILRYSYTKF